MMKKTLKILTVLAISGLIAVSCKKESDQPVIGPDGEKGLVQLTISSEISKTRGSTGEETALSEEVKIDASMGLKVYVFNENGSLDYASPGVLTLTDLGANSFKSTAFEVTAGNKYFFVFANDPATGGKIVAPTSTTTMASFLAQAVTVTGEDATLDIAQANQFLLGTLWKEVKSVEGGGTTSNPKTVSLSIGRLSSKVNLQSINYTTNGQLRGTFTAGEYRIGTLPLTINTVGVHEGNLSPVGNHDVMVTGNVHNTPAFTGAPPVFNTADYIQYSSDFKAVNGTNSFYTTENTTAPDALTGFLYFGNTTYIQMVTVYTPDAAEIYDPVTLASGQSLGGATFWTAQIVSSPVTSTGQTLGAGTRIIITDPNAGALHTDLDPSNLLEYTDGKNYHKFAIFDPRENTDVMRYRVLRNHYYEFKVTNIKALGSHIKEVDPTEPIPTTTSVDIQVTVKNWDKVSSDVEV